MEWLEPRLLLTAQIAYAAIDPPGSVGTESSAVSGSDASAEPTSPPAFVSSATKPPPVVKTSAGARAFMENAPALVIDPAITVTDAGSTTLAGATVTISGNYADGEDVLAFASEYGITGSWDADSGVLTLWGAASLASYQAALRSVTYVDTSTIPSMLTRTISFVTDDGGATDNLSNAATRAVTMSYIDLTGTLGSPWTLPSAVVAGKALAGFTPVVVKNIGDVAVPAGQLVNIQVVAQDTATGAQIALTTLKNQSVSLLAANGSRTFYPYVNVPAGLPADTYQILANIIPVQALPESQTDNNQASQTALGATQTVTAVPPFVDLTGQFSPTMKLPATDTSGDGKLIYVPVVVKNIGNVALPALQKINIEIDASCDGTVTPLKTLTAQYVGSLGAGA